MERLRYIGMLIALITLACLLLGRLAYSFLSDNQRFPIRTVKVSATFQHVTQSQLEAMLTPHVSNSFYAIKLSQLRDDLCTLPWTSKVQVKRIWPDTIKLVLTERVPVAIWNNKAMTAEGVVFDPGPMPNKGQLPLLSGPSTQKETILQYYQKLSKLLAQCDLRAVELHLRDNQSWELSLANGIMLRLGKQDIERRVKRFCQAYPVFTDKVDRISSIDLRYENGMAVGWTQRS